MLWLIINITKHRSNNIVHFREEINTISREKF